MGPSSNVAVAADRKVVGTDQRDCCAGEPWLPFGLMEEGRHCLKRKMDPRLRMDLGLAFHTWAAERLYTQHHHTNCLGGANPFHQPAIPIAVREHM